MASSSGDVLLDATGANGSVVFAGGSAILGTSPVVLFTAGPASESATSAGVSPARCTSVAPPGNVGPFYRVVMRIDIAWLEADGIIVDNCQELGLHVELSALEKVAVR